MSFRKEKKFRVTVAEYHRLKSMLLSQGMEILHQPRCINSIYFDTNNLQMFDDSEEGLLPRKKIRVRWYNKNNKFNLETKTSSIEGRYKTTKALSDVSSEKKILTKSYTDSQYGNIYPSLKVSYSRTYFEFNLMRITFDENIKYSNLRTHAKDYYSDPERVVEIKVPFECEDDYIEKFIPFATARFSKYSRGTLLSTGDLSEF
ncbi:MAG: hypothetical protein CMD72_03465 [Gammaproteobacteria bacterium]|nr:hypothetical protein [Gammaproteobacteria bacterium]|tara:strand:- start:3686 stop:4294 length:609 start_codon:yes stop_codon:yes gene_type:complete